MSFDGRSGELIHRDCTDAMRYSLYLNDYYRHEQYARTWWKRNTPLLQLWIEKILDKLNIWR